MAHDGTGAGWDVTAPANTDPVQDGAKEIRDLRIGVGDRVSKEHEELDVDSAGGEHKHGSAKAYYDTTTPTLRPDGTTSLDSNLITGSDHGRIWYKYDTKELYVREHSGAFARVRLTQDNQIPSGIYRPGPVAILADVKSDGTAGGAFNNGAWRTRTLNTEVSDLDDICDLDTNQFTLPGGTYRVHVVAPASRVGLHQCRLRRVTSGNEATIANGSVSCSADANSQTVSELWVEFNIGSEQTYEVQHRCQNSISGSGFGQPGSFGGEEVYTQVFIWKVGD